MNNSDVNAALKRYLRESRSAHKADLESHDRFLAKVRADVFGRMQSDPDLQAELLKYYKQNKDNLSFRLITDEK